MLTYEQFISKKARQQWVRTIDDFDEFFENSVEAVTIDDLVSFFATNDRTT